MSDSRSFSCSGWAKVCQDLVLLLLWIVVGIWLLLLLNGDKLEVIGSGSMAPALHTGDLIIVRPMTFEDLNEGMIITYQMPGSQNLVTHRIIDIDQKQQTVRTKGDANNKADSSLIRKEQILGHVFFRIPAAGYIIIFFQQCWRILN